MKNNRLFGIVYLLLSNENMTAKKLADYFEVSTRTIYRDIEALSELHIPIYMNKGKKGGICLTDNYKLDKALLTDDEQKEILFSLQGINKLQIATDKTYNKLQSVFLKNDESWFEVDFSIWGESPHHKQSFEEIKKAIINKSVIEFSYFSSYGAQTIRRVEPLKLCFKHNSWYLLGFDQGKKDYRFFKIMRIKDLNILNETFERTARDNCYTIASSY
ncbi:MAG: YafY family transcriptional regulator, partial [Bacilli bacterium]|nr:YafY family transcriptional regulator [Bacilli bacterium]